MNKNPLVFFADTIEMKSFKLYNDCILGWGLHCLSTLDLMTLTSFQGHRCVRIKLGIF